MEEVAVSSVACTRSQILQYGLLNYIITNLRKRVLSAGTTTATMYHPYATSVCS